MSRKTLSAREADHRARTNPIDTNSKRLFWKTSPRVGSSTWVMLSCVRKRAAHRRIAWTIALYRRSRLWRSHHAATPHRTLAHRGLAAPEPPFPRLALPARDRPRDRGHAHDALPHRYSPTSGLVARCAWRRGCPRHLGARVLRGARHRGRLTRRHLDLRPALRADRRPDLALLLGHNGPHRCGPQRGDTSDLAARTRQSREARVAAWVCQQVRRGAPTGAGTSVIAKKEPLAEQRAHDAQYLEEAWDEEMPSSPQADVPARRAAS